MVKPISVNYYQFVAKQNVTTTLCLYQSNNKWRIAQFYSVIQLTIQFTVKNNYYEQHKKQCSRI